MLLARLAIALPWQRRGIGAGLLKDAMRRTLQAAEIGDIHAFAVHGKDDDARRFYTHFSFVPSRTDPRGGLGPDPAPAMAVIRAATPAPTTSLAAPVGAPSSARSARSAASRGEDAAPTEATLWPRVVIRAVVGISKTTTRLLEGAKCSQMSQVSRCRCHCRDRSLDEQIPLRSHGAASHRLRRRLRQRQR